MSTSIVRKLAAVGLAAGLTAIAGTSFAAASDGAGCECRGARIRASGQHSDAAAAA